MDSTIVIGCLLTFSFTAWLSALVVIYFFLRVVVRDINALQKDSGAVKTAINNLGGEINSVRESSDTQELSLAILRRQVNNSTTLEDNSLEDDILEGIASERTIIGVGT